MSGQLIHQPREHYCHPGWTEYQIVDHTVRELNGRIGLRPPNTGTPAGSVWRCDECGRTYVAHYPTQRGAVNLCPKFRPEGRFERWRRERREQASHKQSPGRPHPKPPPPPPPPKGQ